MRPQFRSDLQASREEQQGVVFYRIDDPQTQTSFRLYEIEYLIARKLDGQRTLPDVIGAVKSEYNFDITEPDLKKFVSQLESMGFIHSGPDPASAAPAAPKPAPRPPLNTQPMPTLAQLQAAPTAPVGAAAAVVRTATGESLAPFAGEDAPTAVTTTASIQNPLASLPPEEPEEPDVLDEVPMDEGDLTTSPSPLNSDPTMPMGGGDDAFSVPTVERMAPMESLDPEGLEPRRSTTGPEKVLGMIRSGFEHLRKGFVVNARDYFNAARETRPEDERLVKIATHLAMVPDEATPQELEQLWNTAKELFPEIAAEVAADLESSGDFPAEEQPLRSRWLWGAILVVVVLLAAAALFYVTQEMKLFQGATVVEVARLESARVPLYHDQPALEVGALREQWLAFDGSGPVVQAVEASTRVKAGDVLVMLELPKPAQKKLEKAKENLDKAQAQYDKVAASLEEILDEREAIEAERNDAEAKLKELSPDNILKPSGSTKKEMEKHKKAIVKANKKLSKLAKKERKPRAQEKKAKQKVEKAAKALSQAEQKFTDKLLRAPFDGMVVDTRYQSGADAQANKEGVLLRDASGVKLVFVVADAGELQPGGEAQVAADDGEPIVGKVLSVQPGDDGVRLEIRVPDDQGTLAGMEAAKFRLVRDMVDGAYQVSSAAVVEPEDGAPVVFVANGDRVSRRAVEVLGKGPSRAVIRPTEGSLKDGDQVVVAVPQLGSVAVLQDNAAVEISQPVP